MAIHGAGKIYPTVIVADTGTTVHRILPLSLAIYHRAATGGEASRFPGMVI